MLSCSIHNEIYGQLVIGEIFVYKWEFGNMLTTVL